MVFDGIVELFRNKKTEVQPRETPKVGFEEKEQELANLQTVSTTVASRDFRSPSTDAQDANRIRVLQNQIAEIKSKEPASPQTTPPTEPGITQIPVEENQTPVEEPKAA